MKRTIVIAAFIIIALGALFFAFNSYIYSEKQGDGAALEPYRATLSGRSACLPHKGPGPHSKECMLGIKTDQGEYYALDFSGTMMTQLPPGRESTRFTASGDIMPVAYLGNSEWSKYEIEGIFSVTDSVVFDEEIEPVPEQPVTAKECYVGGCSSQLCSDTPGMASTCEYRDAYACYQGATCERQPGGACGWTPTAQMTACLADAQ